MNCSVLDQKINNVRTILSVIIRNDKLVKYKTTTQKIGLDTKL